MFPTEKTQKIEPRNGKDTMKTLHAVIVPFPAQGHVTPALQLAKKLVGLGFRITFVNTIHIHERMMKSRSKAAVQDDKDIEFVAVPDGLPDDHPRLNDLCAFCKTTTELGPVFKEVLADLLRKSSITCVIRDAVLTAVHGSAKKLGIPIVVLATPSAIAMQCIYHLQTFVANEVLPLPAPPLGQAPSLDPVKLTIGLPRSEPEIKARQAPLTCLPGGSPTMRVDDIPTFLVSHDLDAFFPRFFRELQNPFLPDSECILYNTYSALEGDILNAMAGDMNSHTYAIGPLVFDTPPTSSDGVGKELSLLGAGSASSLWEEDPISLAWLDHQAPKSVLFVSFGSITTVSMQQIQEFATGLELSKHAFLWVIRPDLIESICADNGHQGMFSDFMGRTRDRGLLVPWAPQTAVLSHPSVAAFLTHCGWNSTIESISCGIPMLGWPRFADQNTNCHYIVHVWKTGLALQGHLDPNGATVVSKEEIANKVKKIMACDKTDLEVDEIRNNTRNFQIEARKAVERGGSSQTALMKFVELIKGITKCPTFTPSSNSMHI
ncbi:hypothetical protein KC19_5G181600 [Ceratodon purpureus]|uniref:Glycosyltransferase n=1 Tax=Ceratodon purpureus TaxID=3225 RepID=A0A8T0I2V5_CERPU|nr:hypothetical protein KC19_5G181600 [Ceratodon purpureus]